MSRNIEKQHHQTFEEIKNINSAGVEFWMARKLSKILEYREFRNFLPVIEKAQNACSNSGQTVENHFVEMNEMVPIGSGAERQMSSYLDFAIFQNHDYKGLYGGLDAKGIHKNKALKKSQKILDNMGSTELAANLF